MQRSAPTYVIAGRGRWAGVIHEVLTNGGGSVHTAGDVRRKADESHDHYRERIFEALTGADIAWICVPPCPDLLLLIETAISAGLHVVVEKPWMHSEADTEPLARLAEGCGVVAGVHFQYCFLDAVQVLRRELRGADACKFSGTFTLSRPDRLALPAIHNLGSHLLAIREYAAPGSEVVEIRCGYEMRDERRVCVESAGGLARSIELTTDEPLITRYVTAFENSIPELKFPLDLRFAARVFAAASKLTREFGQQRSKDTGPLPLGRI